MYANAIKLDDKKWMSSQMILNKNWAESKINNESWFHKPNNQKSQFLKVPSTGDPKKRRKSGKRATHKYRSSKSSQVKYTINGLTSIAVASGAKGKRRRSRIMEAKLNKILKFDDKNAGMFYFLISI